MVLETKVQSWVESYQRLKKWYLIPPCLTLSIIRYGSRVKWSNPGKGVVPFPTLRCCNYWKGSLRVPLDYGCQLYLLSNECLPMVRETGVQSHVKLYQRLKKWYSILLCLTLSIIRYGSRVKWSNPGNGVAPSPTPWCSSYWKGSLWVTLHQGHQKQLIKIVKKKVKVKVLTHLKKQQI